MLTAGRVGTVTSVNSGRSGHRGAFEAQYAMRRAVGLAVVAVLLLIPTSRVHATTLVVPPPQLVVSANIYAGSDRLGTTMLVLGGIATVLLAIYLLASRERAARAARDRAAYYQQLFAAVPEPALLVDNTDGQLRIEAVNGALGTLRARKESDRLGSTLGSIMFVGQADVSKTLTSLEDRSLTSARWQFVTSDRTLIPVEVKMSNLQ